VKGEQLTEGWRCRTSAQHAAGRTGGERDQLMQRRGLRRVPPWCLAALAAAVGPWGGGAFAQPAPDMTLTGILLGPTRVAIISTGGHTFVTKVGEPVGDAVVVGILPTKVVLKQGQATFELQAPFARHMAVRPAVSPNSAAPAPAVAPKSTPVASASRRAPAPTPGGGMTVTGILEGRSRVAIVQAGGQSFVAAAGDSVGDALVVSVLPGKVVLKKDGALFELTLGRTVGPKSSS
jgi:type II secretory pathway component PulC